MKAWALVVIGLGSPQVWRQRDVVGYLNWRMGGEEVSI